MTIIRTLYGAATSIRRDRLAPTLDELDARRSGRLWRRQAPRAGCARYTYIPTMQCWKPLLATRGASEAVFCLSGLRAREPGSPRYAKHMLRLRRAGQITQKEVREIVLLNSHDGTSSYRACRGCTVRVCSNGLVCSQSLATSAFRIKAMSSGER
ncbi:DUF932 domain-containing protein [Salmonella enterica subsp. enterica]|nr:DUF932 domain-containing protein [Salmonella enterica subsp. enterica]